MKTLKLTSLLMMLFVAFNAAAQGEFFDDVYFSSSKNKKEKQVEEKKTAPTQSQTQMLAIVDNENSFSYGRDVDEYNRRYTPNEEYIYEETDTLFIEENGRHSDMEYSERIIRYHSPSKITIVGADQIDLYLSDGFYGYGYNAYDNGAGGANVNFNINVGNSWGYNIGAMAVGTTLGIITHGLSAITLGGVIHPGIVLIGAMAGELVTTECTVLIGITHGLTMDGTVTHGAGAEVGILTHGHILEI